MKVTETALPEVKIIEPVMFEDERGFYLEAWNARMFREPGLEAAFVQDNHGRSGHGVLRGLHCQIELAQGKLVQAVSGRVFDVAVDLRRHSRRFGQWVGVELSAENKRQVWIPPGFAHGFLALEDGTDCLYKCTDYWSARHERSLRWNDPDLRIDWPLGGIGQPRLSPKDLAAPRLTEVKAYP